MKVFDEYSKKRVSYILVTKNRAEMLEKALARCGMLKKTDDELIVVDGASTDFTAKVVQKYKDIVDIFLSEPDKHSAEAANKGILLAKGKYIKYIADDDLYNSEAIDKAVEIMEKNSEIDLLLCGGVKEYNGRKRVVCLPSGVNYGQKTEDLFIYKGADTGVGHFFRRSAFAKIGMIGTNVNSDKELVLRCIKNNGVVKFARINLYHHFLFDHSVILKSALAHGKDTLRLAKIYCSRQFYWKFKIIMFFKENKFLKPFYFIYLGLKRRFKKPSAKIEPVWDGGFS